MQIGVPSGKSNNAKMTKTPWRINWDNGGKLGKLGSQKKVKTARENNLTDNRYIAAKYNCCTWTNKTMCVIYRIVIIDSKYD